MEIKKNYIVIIATVLMLILAGCRASPIYNIEDAPIQVDGKYSANQVKKAIIRAGAGLGWTMKAKEPGMIVGTLFLRQHVTIINVRFTKKAYSITYKDSQNLNKDGTNIHKNYNIWIQNLNRQIQVQLSAI